LARSAGRDGCACPAGFGALSSANDTARNAETNALANVGNSSASAGTAVSAASETMVPLSAFVHFKPGKTALNVNHQYLFVASTISFTVAGRAAVAQG